MAKTSSKKAPAKTTSKKTSAKRSPKKTTMDRIKDAALSSEMLAAGVAASGAAVAANPRARRALYEAGVDAADAAGSAALQLKNSAVKLSALIGEAVADAVLRALTSDWLTEDRGSGKSKRSATSTSSAKKVSSARRSPGKSAGKSKAGRKQK